MEEEVTAARIDELIWHCAGLLGLHPGAFTLRELLAMVKARRVEAWEHTSRIVAATLNVWSSKPIQPDDVNPVAHLKQPTARRERKLAPRASFNLLAGTMVR